MCMKKNVNVKVGQNGHRFVTLDSVEAIFHATDGNSKTGRCGNYNVPVELTCNHQCECYKTGKCYACSGCYNFISNQTLYSENLKFYRDSTLDVFVKAITEYIKKNNLDKFRYFTCGDIPDGKFFVAMIEIARINPTVEFWAYTKKYNIVNTYCNTYGVESIPENLTIIFSHWLNDDGTYFPMNNPYNFPTSEFIPLGKEYLIESVTHVCPCSDPTKKATCATCDHPCYRLKHGESMALLEHSTQRTKERDKKIKEQKALL